MTKQKIHIGLLGFGTVGRSVYEILEKNRSLFARKMNAEIVVKWVCVQDPNKERNIDAKLITTDAKKIAEDPDVSIVVELIGNKPEALEAIELALKNGNSVVTANKALIAKHGPHLFQLAKENGCEILFEASVGGGIPILRTLREGLGANHILTLKGIINGTSNYILSKMTGEGADFETVLKEAQSLGYAEADPASDIEGEDAAYKLVILAMLCHGKVVDVKDVFCRGIAYIKPLDIQMADQFGYVIKHLGITKLHGEEFETRVHPTMIPKHKPLAHVHGAFNAIEYDGDFAGRGMLYGQGAGGGPTASAVVGDIIELTRNILSQNQINLEPCGFLPKELTQAKPKDARDLVTRYYIRFSVLDKPNVLAQVTACLGHHGISIQHLYQHGEQEDQVIPLIVFTHEAKESNVRAALKEIDGKDFITETTKIIRIEDE